MAKTESISDEQIAEIIEALADICAGDTIDEDQATAILRAKVFLRAANSDGGVEPVAWVPVSANGQSFWLEIQTRMEHFAGHWAADGYTFKPLFAHPPAKALDGIAVRALEWVKPTGELGSLRRAETIVGVYRVWTYAEADTWFWSLMDGVETSAGSGSQQKCVDAAQADFDQRIRSALK